MRRENRISTRFGRETSLTVPKPLEALNRSSMRSRTATEIQWANPIWMGTELFPPKHHYTKVTEGV